ncbi:hypothetical protein [Pedobacter sp. JY14-1]|uniref:hypothetical protein n=1 Tax=Pedobacter sp. JY14-1 TaxID=3034151 RepID=UPI0023E13FBD|nr:hypothetical protein [Pedobacter sp. JY14-1]
MIQYTRKILLALAMVLQVYYVAAQTNTFPASGDVGIATTSPRGALDVAKYIPSGALGTIFGRLLEGDNEGNGTFLGVRGYATNVLNSRSFAIIHNFYGQTNSSINFLRGSAMTGGAISFSTNSDIERMRIDHLGNVGIGTTNPLSKFQIATSDKTGEIRIGGANGVNSGRVFIAADMVNDRSYIDVYGDNTFKKLFIDASVLALNNVSSGNVGIGTANTQGYKLAVNGSIRAKEIKVESANWPDYVFTEDYKLPTLAETETHIKEKGHLPGIPSATEVKKNGVELGEMNKKLLEKIEELTLHLIETKKRDDTQQAEIEALKKTLVALVTDKK